MYDEQPGMSQQLAHPPHQRLPPHSQSTRHFRKVEVEGGEERAYAPAHDDLVSGVVAEVVAAVSYEKCHCACVPRLHIQPPQPSVLVQHYECGCIRCELGMRRRHTISAANC